MAEKPEAREIVMSTLKGALGSIAGVGLIVAGVVGTVIPNYRVRRLEKLVGVLARSLNGIDIESLRPRFNDPELLDILEDGFIQTARAVSDERIEHIAAIVKNSLTAEQ